MCRCVILGSKLDTAVEHRSAFQVWFFSHACQPVDNGFLENGESILLFFVPLGNRAMLNIQICTHKLTK